MLRKEFVKRLRNVSGVQMVSVFMMFNKPKIWFFLDDWRIPPDLIGSAALGTVTADTPGALLAARRRKFKG